MVKQSTFDRLCLSGTAGGGGCRQNFFRTVSFSEQVQIDRIPNIKALSKRQRKALWYPEPTKSRGIFKQIICAKSSEGRGDGDEVKKIDDRSDKSLPISAVLSEQENQREGNIGGAVDDQELAKVYRKCSSYSCIRAHMRALDIQKDATEYLRQPSKHGRQRIILLEDDSAV